jgi:hypothetical protein
MPRPKTNFIIGQKVVCVKKGLWDDQYGELHQSPAKYNEIYTVSWVGYIEPYLIPYLSLSGLQGKFRQDKFEPIVSDEVLAAELESCIQLKTA